MTSCLAIRTDDALAGYRSLKNTDTLITYPKWRGTISVVDEISVTREGGIDIVAVAGEYDMSNVDALNDALQKVLSDETTSCLLDLSAVTFMDSSVVHTLVRWSKEAQVSEREALAIMVGGADTPAAKLLGLVGLLKRLPVFATRAAAKAALDLGKRPRLLRPLTWLTDLELATERDDAQIGADAANKRLDDAVAEQESRDADTTPES
jgi:anti-anti-sigma factor